MRESEMKTMTDHEKFVFVQESYNKLRDVLNTADAIISNTRRVVELLSAKYGNTVVVDNCTYTFRPVDVPVKIPHCIIIAAFESQLKVIQSPPVQ